MNCAACDHHRTGIDRSGTFRDRACMRISVAGADVHFALGPDDDTGCPACTEAARQRNVEEQREFEARERQRRVASALKSCGIPPLLARCRFENYRVTLPGQQEALEVARDFAARFDEYRERCENLIFAGNCGTGKDHLACAIAMRLMSAGRTAYFGTAREVVMDLRRSWDDASAPSEHDVTAMLKGVDLLVLSDVGAGATSDAARDQLCTVIDGRTVHLRPTIITTNLPPDALKEALGDRAYDRFRGTRVVPFDWGSYRGSRA